MSMPRIKRVTGRHGTVNTPRPEEIVPGEADVEQRSEDRRVASYDSRFEGLFMRQWVPFSLGATHHRSSI